MNKGSQTPNAMPPYSVRISARAKRINLRITPRLGLEVVLPEWCDPAMAAEVVRSRQEWVEKTFQKMRDKGCEPGAPPQPPQSVVFQAIDRTISVNYEPSARPGLRLYWESPEDLRFEGRTGDVGACLELLRGWLKDVAKRSLPPLLARVARETGLSFNKVSVRLQRSRWGSCSGQKNISLNAKLLFLPWEEARYVLLHELCHTRYLAHNAPFWDLLVRLEPRARELDKAVNAGWRHVPAWVG